MTVLCGANLAMLSGLLGCASTQTGQAHAEFAQCRNAFKVRVTLERPDGSMQIRSGHPCPAVVFALDASAEVRVFAPDRSATAWDRLDSRVALREGASAPYWNLNTLEVAVQKHRDVRPTEAPVGMQPGDFFVFVYRHSGGGTAMELLAASGEVTQQERLGASVAAKTLAYGFAGILDLLSLPLLPFIIVSGAMTGG